VRFFEKRAVDMTGADVNPALVVSRPGSLQRIDIVKRKRIRFAGRGTRGGDEGETFRSTTPAVLFRVLATSRDLSLTAKIPDVFEAKLVFSNRKTQALGGKRSPIAFRFLISSIIKCQKGVRWMPWR
jgi:hypothetical protein